MKYSDDIYIAQTRCWLEQVVLKHNLCPFAHKPFHGGQVRLVVTDSARPEYLLEDLQRELEFLRATAVAEVETTLLIHPNTLVDFLDYNDFLDIVDALLEQEGLQAIATRVSTGDECSIIIEDGYSIENEQHQQVQAKPAWEGGF